jgi:hypothetical protein
MTGVCNVHAVGSKQSSNHTYQRDRSGTVSSSATLLLLLSDATLGVARVFVTY